nr:hypothetical protein BaRGS_006208 [Batillaria attramentaria]
MYAKDPILEAMVLDKLGGEGDVMCRVCPNKEATQICLDCADKYCDTCSHAHMKMTFSQDHMQAQLSELSEMNQVAPAASRVSLTTENLNRDTLLQEAALCDELEAQLKFSIDSIDTSLKALETLRQRLEEQECLLAAYATRCANPDDFVMVIARTMLPRLRRVREDCVAPSDAELSTLTQYSNAVIHSVDRSADHLSGEMQGPMKSVPRKLFLLPPDTPTDTNKSGSFITALAATEDGLLVMVDENNKMIKTADLANPRRAVHSKVLLTMPHGVTLFQDKQNLGAVTASDKCIYIVDVSDVPHVLSKVKTGRQYKGVASVREDNTLVVGCCSDDDGPASVDVITRDGVMLKTAEGSTFTNLCGADNLCISCGEVLVCDSKANAVYRVKLDTGRVVLKLTHADMQGPTQVSTDYAGNCYIACSDSQCVMVVTRTGQWRKLLHGPRDGDGPRVKAHAVCAIHSALVVAWHSDYSILAGYNIV